MNEYAIISIDDSRESKKQWTRQRFTTWIEANIDFVNGKNPQTLANAKKKWKSVSTPGPFKAGEFGIFYSVLNCLEYGADNNGILYFEDDAMPVTNFQERLESYLNDLPINADLFAVWSPHNQHGDYLYASGFNNVGEPEYNDTMKKPIFDYGHKEISYLWQGYGNVSMAFTKTGCKKLLQYIKKNGFFSPIDCLICICAHGGYINGFSLKPKTPLLVNYDWDTKTTIHGSAWGMIEDLIR